MDELIKIPAHPHLAEWMKETNIMGKAFRGELGEISEWAARKALWDWPVGTQVTLQELTDRAHRIQMGLTLNSMVDKGLRSAVKRDKTRGYDKKFLKVLFAMGQIRGIIGA